MEKHNWVLKVVETLAIGACYIVVSAGATVMMMKNKMMMMKKKNKNHNDNMTTTTMIMMMMVMVMVMMMTTMTMTMMTMTTRRCICRHMRVGSHQPIWNSSKFFVPFPLILMGFLVQPEALVEFRHGVGTLNPRQV